MDITYVHTQKRSELGKPCRLVDVGPEALVDLEGDPWLKERFYTVPTVSREVDSGQRRCQHQVNTDSQETGCRGMSHKEGGWPASVDTADEDSTARFRKNITKNKSYETSVLKMAALVEEVLDDNNSIDVFEEYFAGERIKPDQETSFRCLNVMADLDHRSDRRVVEISWSTDSSKLVAAYSPVISAKSPDAVVESYVWDVTDCVKPCCVLFPESPLSCVEFFVLSNLVAGGYASGLVALWDCRVGGHAQQVSTVSDSHSESVTSLKWKDGFQFFSSSTDGRVMKWDARNISSPTSVIHLHPESADVPNIDREYSASCMDYDPTTRELVVGTQQGHVLRIRLGKNLVVVDSFACFEASSSPVIGVATNVFLPELFASVDPWMARVWDSRNADRPVLNLVGGGGYYSDVAWSPSRASALFLCKTTGQLEVWDVPCQPLCPMSSIALEREALLSVELSGFGDRVACGSASGRVHVLAVPSDLKGSTREELEFFARSVQRPVEGGRQESEGGPDDGENCQ